MLVNCRCPPCLSTASQATASAPVMTQSNFGVSAKHFFHWTGRSNMNPKENFARHSTLSDNTHDQLHRRATCPRTHLHNLVEPALESPESGQAERCNEAWTLTDLVDGAACASMERMDARFKLLQHAKHAKHPSASMERMDARFKLLRHAKHAKHLLAPSDQRLPALLNDGICCDKQVIKNQTWERASSPTWMLSLHHVTLMVLKFHSWGTSTKHQATPGRSFLRQSSTSTACLTSPASPWTGQRSGNIFPRLKKTGPCIWHARAC